MSGIPSAEWIIQENHSIRSLSNLVPELVREDQYRYQVLRTANTSHPVPEA